MPALRDYAASLESRPWTRGIWQGIAIGLGVALGGIIGGMSWTFVVAGGAGVGLFMAALLGFLLRIQQRGRDV
jgi:membrane-associated phospholipid phosphatase